MPHSQSIFNLDIETDEIVLDAIRFIWDSLSEKINDNYIGTLEIPFTVKLAVQKINKIVSLATSPHDGSVVQFKLAQKNASEEFLEFMEPDYEPSPSVIDTWARGVVNTKKIAIEDSGFRRTIPGAPNSTPSVSSFRSSVPGRSKGTSLGTKSRLGTPGMINSRAGNDSLDQTGKIIELTDESEGDFANLNSTGSLFDQLQRTKRNKAQGYVQKDTTEKGEFEIIQEQMEKAAKELSGKSFVLDRYGKPVVLGKVKTESLPPLSVSLALNVLPTNGNGESVEDTRTGFSSTSDGVEKGKKGRPFLRVAGSRGIEESFKPIISLATTLSGIETIPKVNQGVSIKNSTDVRKGEDIPDDPKRMSKKQYMSRSTLSHSLHDTSLTSLNNNSSKLIGMRDEKSFAGFPYDGLNTTGSSLSITSKSIEMLPDIDYLEGGKKVTFSSPTIHDMSDEELGLGPIKQKAPTDEKQLGKLPSKRTAQQRASIEALNGSPDNGASASIYIIELHQTPLF